MKSQEVYSNYKSHTTFKYLVGISPHPAVVYVSKAWGGRASDKRITETSADLLDKLKPNDEVMANRGFEIEGALLLELSSPFQILRVREELSRASRKESVLKRSLKLEFMLNEHFCELNVTIFSTVNSV